MSGGYELHQKLRTKAVRLLKKKDYAQAISILHTGAVDLLKQKEQGSGCDIAVYLVDVYEQSDAQVNDETRGRLVEILDLTAPDFWRKKVADAALKWSAKASGQEGGDPTLRISIAQLYAREGSFHIAEPHYIAGCVKDGSAAQVDASIDDAAIPAALAQLEVDWLKQHSAATLAQEGESRAQAVIERLEVGKFALRALLPLLAQRALSASQTFLSTFTQLVTKQTDKLLIPIKPNPKPYTPQPALANIPSALTDLQIYVTSSPDLNFAQMTLGLVAQGAGYKSSRRGAVPMELRNAWISVVRQYQRENSEFFEEEEYVSDALTIISSIYFDIAPPRGQGNMLQDMMSSLFGGGGQQSKPATLALKSAGVPSLPKVEQAVVPAAPAAPIAVAAPAAPLDEEELD
ncbi:unnamed protein product [Tilletia controversa]|uniref:Golgi to ER traffic protein 4 n=2 Tax=Tilletia TaxID=13289 RepID=A0A177V1U1_9BASI|nr:hypothetical protein CF335_g3627 [Tilletia laevis]KAE8260659.1 hypothetical protein A4X03_0g3736 [Tilletia caries]CAD6918827.1 unnamed protein product [Tilletia controversa]CAD6893792.1 unnamed protein product [Tilletia caries]CAD6897606.1 unnamed protein product [Tilletia caries]